MTEHAGRENRHSYIVVPVRRFREDITRAGEFRDVELLIMPGAIECLFGIHRHVVDVAAFDTDAPVRQRTDTIVIPRADG